MVNKKFKFKRELGYWINLFIGVTLALFVWLTWKKLTLWVNNDNLVWMIAGGIVFIAILKGRYSVKGVLKNFSK